MVQEFRQSRTDWFNACAKRVMRDAHIVPQLQLAGRAEVLTKVYQCVLAIGFIASHRYIGEKDGSAFTTLMFAEVGEGKDLGQRSETLNRFLAMRQHDQGEDLGFLSRGVAHELACKGEFLEDEFVAGVVIAQTIPTFMLITYRNVATAFGDEATAEKVNHVLRSELR